MKVYTYSEARQRFAEVLNIARKEEAELAMITLGWLICFRPFRLTVPK